MKNILFVYEHENPQMWMDGLWAAVKYLEKDFNVTWINLHGEDMPAMDFDFMLGWGGFNSLVDKWVMDHRVKKGLCIGGNAFPYHPGYDVLFHETDWIKDYLKLEGKCVKAFGINDGIYGPIDIAVPIVWDYIGVGAFANWKRWERMCAKRGNKLVVGQYQIENEDESLQIVQKLIQNKVMVSDMVHPFDLANFYHWSRTLYMPANINGGGERVVLEARACGLNVEIEDDNPKLKELLTCSIPTAKEYAENLKKGILSCFN